MSAQNWSEGGAAPPVLDGGDVAPPPVEGVVPPVSVGGVVVVPPVSVPAVGGVVVVPVSVEVGGVVVVVVDDVELSSSSVSFDAPVGPEGPVGRRELALVLRDRQALGEPT